MPRLYVSNENNTVVMDTDFGRGPKKKLPLDVVGDVITACAKEPTRGLLGLPSNAPLTLHMPAGESLPPLPDNEMDDRVNADGSLRPGLRLTKLGPVGQDDRRPLVIKARTSASLLSSTAMDIVESTKLSDFWNCLTSVAPVNDYLTFSPTPPVRRDIPKQFFIRKCYKDMFKIIWDKAQIGINSKEERGTSGFAITGNPGIGKSIFLFYVMWRLRNMVDVKTIVLHRAKDAPWIYVFDNERCFQTTNYAFLLKYLESPVTWYLTDTLPVGPSIVDAITVVVASPSRKHYKDFLKFTKTAPLFYLPVWDLEELLSARRMYDLSPEVVEERYNLIGGIARFVFEKPHRLHVIIKKALGRLNIDNFQLMVDGALSKEDEISHLIIHFVVSDDYHDFSLQFASKYILEKALESFITQEKSKLQSFLIASDSETLLSSLRGNLFESFAHSKLSEGGTFKIRSLDSTAAPTVDLVFPARQKQTFKDIKNCTDSNVLYTAAQKNYPCIDSLIPSVGLFQMTVSRSHGVKMVELKKIMEDSGMSKLYFVVPQTRFSGYPKQNLLATGGTVAVNIGGVLKKLSQFVLAIDVQ